MSTAFSILTRRRALQLAASAAGAACPVAFPAQRASAQPLQRSRLRIGIANPPVGQPPAMSSGGVLSIVHAKGWMEREFAADGTAVEWFFFKGSGPAVNEALGNGDLDLAFQGDLPAIIGRAGGLRTRALMSLVNRNNTYLAVPRDSAIQGVADLRGRRVAVAKGTATQLPVNRILQLHGLAERDVRVYSLDSATSQAALASRDIDAAFGGATLLKLRNAGLARIVYSTKAAPDATGQSLALATEAFAQARPEAVARFVRVAARAAHWAAQPANRREVFDIFARGGTPADVWAEEYGDTPLAVRLSPVFDPFLTARLQQAVDDAARYRLTRRRFEVADWIDRGPLDRALRDLGLAGFWRPYGADARPLA